MFWFLIKNIIPRGQGCNQIDAMDQCLTDLMDKGEQINLPTFMIKHIARIANTTRAHDLGYGFLLTRVFEYFGVELQRKVDAQVIDEVGSSIIMGVALISFRRVIPVPNRECKHPLRLFLTALQVSLLIQ